MPAARTPRNDDTSVIASPERSEGRSNLHKNKMNKKLKQYKIGVLAGGVSSEREISLKSGTAVFKALEGLGLDVKFIDVSDKDFCCKVNFSDIDLAFIALHGRFGEDGTIQEFLEDEGILYTGSGPAASRLALDKLESKIQFTKAGIRIPEYCIANKGADTAKIRPGFPCAVKPRYEGSSVGLSIVREQKQLEAALEKSFAYDDDAIVEKFIKGKEITVGMLDQVALPVVEIVTLDNIYDYEAKYRSQHTEYIAPATIEEEVAQEAREIAIKAHTTLGCEGFSRVDFRVDEDNKIFILEVNTIPGLTERSLLPMAAAAYGLTFSDLCVKMLDITKKKGGNGGKEKV